MSIQTPHVDGEFDSLFNALVELARMNMQILLSGIVSNTHITVRKKPDGTSITNLDLEINWHSAQFWMEKFPNVSFDGEEMPFLKPGAEYVFREDPVDNTNGAIAINQDKSIQEKPCVTYMASMSHRGTPVAFALGLPIKTTLYYGSIYHGLYYNDSNYELKLTDDARIVGVGDSKKQPHFFRNVHIAGELAKLILEGKVKAAKNPFPLRHESACIAAAARCGGATVTNQYGGEFQPANSIDGMVLSFKPINHQEFLKTYINPH